MAGNAAEDPAEIARREARIMARVAEDARVKGRTPGEALASITDLVRYTLEYPAGQYAHAVRADIERLRREGYVDLAVRNCWTCPAWKGISTSWQEPGSGQLFEVQFHTPESRAARDQTYPAYQRLRSAGTTDAERAAIMAAVRDVYAGKPAAHAPASDKQRAAVLHFPAERDRSRSFRQVPADPAAEEVSYYAIVDRYSGEDSPAGVLRRVEHPGGQRDEAFGRDLRWRHTFLLYSWERGNLDNSLYPVGADRAQRLTDQVRRSVTRPGTW